MRILVVEDHGILGQTIGTGLRREGMAVDVVLDGSDALARLAVNPYDVVVLDRDLPGVHGDDVCRKMAEDRRETRILMLTASAAVEDRVVGLGLGADDYLPKPFDFSELVARIRALGRRAPQVQPVNFVHGDLVLDPARRHASPRRPGARPQPEGVRGAGVPDGGGRQARLDRGTARSGLGRGCGPVHHDREDDHPPPAEQARRPARDPDGSGGWIPDRDCGPLPRLTVPPRRWLPRRTLRLRLAAFYGGVFMLSGIVLLAIPNVLGRASSSVAVSPNGPPPPVPRAVLLRQHGLDLHNQLVFSGLALVLLVLASFGLGWVIAGRVLRPLRVITATAREISATNLHRRLALRGADDELRELGATLDELFSRLESSFDMQRRFVANASHELRTPLTAERALLQVALADPDASVDSLRATCEQVLALGGQQQRLIAALLTLAATERGVERWELFDLSRIVDEAVASRHGEAVERQVTLSAECRPARCAGDPRLVEIMVSNLLDNAVRHNVEGGWARVVMSTGPAGAVLGISNTGPLIRPDEVDRLLEPFQRKGGAHVAAGEGHGLGLAIVKAVTRVHGARLVATARPEGGLEIEVTFATAWPSTPAGL